MAHLTDFESLVRSEPVQAARKTPQPAASLTHSHSTLEGLLYPIVIVNRQGNICFMNGAARHLLAEGLHRRLASHICSNPEMGPITQVHFKLQNGHDLVLKVRLGEIEWLGEKAIQVMISNVTPYLAMIQELQKEPEAQKRALEELVALQPEVEQQLAAHSETPAKLQAELEAETAARSEAQDNARGLRENLDLVTQENSRLRSDLAAQQSPEKEIAALRQELAAAEQARSEWAETFERLKGEARGHADALARAHEEAAEAARFAKAQETKAAEAEKQAASTARELEQVRGELSRRMSEAQVSKKAWAQERAEFQRRAPEGPEQAAAQTAQELRSLRLKLDSEIQARRLAQEKIAQLQREMARYRQTLGDPAALREVEERLSVRVQELVAAEERVYKLTEELRSARAANVRQDERVDKLRWLASELKKKYDALGASVKTLVQGQDLLRVELQEETAKRLAAEAETERLQRKPAPAKPEEPESEKMDAGFVADLRKDIQTALKAALSLRA